jgi:Protein of unknown function (DUF4058)
MPLLDHFHPPLEGEIAWTTLHNGWATRIADDLNERWLGREFIAAEISTSGLHSEIDIAAYERPSVAQAPLPGMGPAVATLARPTWEVAEPAMTFAVTFPELFEVHIFVEPGRRNLVGVIELVSPSNKDRPGTRRAFAAKTVAYLQQGVSIVVIDIVTNKRFNLHNEIVELLAAPQEAAMDDNSAIYAVSYRPTLRNDEPQVDLWRERLAVGKPLPTMPLRLTGDLFVPVQFETTYLETCRRRRLI